MPFLPHETPAADVCAHVREHLTLRALLGNKLSDATTLSGGWLQHMRMLEAGLLPPPPHVSQPPLASQPPWHRAPDGAEANGAPSSHLIVANFQAHLPSFAPSFDGGECLRVVPGIGDTIQIVAGRNGGVEAYLNLPAAGQRALTDEGTIRRELGL